REERFSAFVASHRERARRLAWRLVGGDDAAAEDVVQEALVRAYRALPGFRAEASLATWFYRILVRQAQNYRRWRAVRALWSGEGRAALPAAVSDGYGDPGLRRRIAQALDRLSRRQREAFILVHLEGFTVQECADLLGKPVGTVKSHLHRALTTLRQELVDVYEPQGAPRS
ncbi:MAG: RNA polymerase sigma factor, partial [Candidatus Binatia bacterium]|nr:RNA polymerase sigma factor [Candidatus Binatia bacterium]